MNNAEKIKLCESNIKYTKKEKAKLKKERKQLTCVIDEQIKLINSKIDRYKTEMKELDYNRIWGG